MVNPNKYIRIAYRTAMLTLGYPVWTKKVPKNQAPLLGTYIIIASQTKIPTVRDKDSFEWLCSIVFDITHIMEQGYSNTDVLDDLEEQVINIVESDIAIGDFTVKDITMVDSRDLIADTDSQTIERRLVTYQFWLSNEDG